MYRRAIWQNITENGEILSTHRVKSEAAEVGRELAEQRRTEHIVHDMAGGVSGRDDYRLRNGSA